MVSRSEREFHRRAGAECFNRAWDYLDRKNRSLEDDLQMLHLAHASRFHWGLVGTPRNLAVGEWQISRVYAALRQPQLALWFAKSCLATCKSNALEDLVHTADEAMARAYAVGEDRRKARVFLERARRQLAKLALEKRDRAVYLDQIRETEAMIRRR
jgi:hypothetical protein